MAAIVFFASPHVSPTFLLCKIHAIAKVTGEKPRHLGMPAQAFDIGQYSMNKNGMLTVPDCNDLMQQLIEGGFQAD